jgi:hypothetical protein
MRFWFLIFFVEFVYFRKMDEPARMHDSWEMGGHFGCGHFEQAARQEQTRVFVSSLLSCSVPKGTIRFSTIFFLPGGKGN